MLFTNDRQQLRKIFFDAWQKAQAGQTLSPLEGQLANIIALHPEYHAILAHPAKYLEAEYSPELGETNPFLHLSLHMSVLEQIATDRPQGIVQIYQALCSSYGDAHQAEHQMMDCLAQGLWKIQQGSAYEEQDYLAALTKLLR